MHTIRFAALAARHNEGLSVYGPFATRSDARLGVDWLDAHAVVVLVMLDTPSTPRW